MKLLKHSAILAVSVSCALHATNGDQIIGVGAKTRAMGGAGIAISNGAESTLVNPAAITSEDKTNITFGGTIFKSNVKTKIDPITQGKMYDSGGDKNIIPLVAIASKLYPDFFGGDLYGGIGMYGTAGMGIDFRGKPDLFDMETTLQLIQFAVPIAYKYNNFSIGVAPILQYGSLDINYKQGSNKVGYGQKQDYGYGASVGAVYNLGHGITVGAVYKSKIKMDYPDVITKAAKPMGVNTGDRLSQPAELGVGIAYKNGHHTIAVDYKKIKWGSADGYKEFNWKDQNVFAIGYEYRKDNWALRAGYNHASSPIKLTKGDTPTGAALNMFNLLGFPATSKNHFTLGGEYIFSKNFSVDLAFVYSPSSKTSANISGVGLQKIYNEHSEGSVTVGLNYKF